MRLVVQRVDNASVTIENELFSSIGQGYLILFGAEEDRSLMVLFVIIIWKKETIFCHICIFYEV